MKYLALWAGLIAGITACQVTTKSHHPEKLLSRTQYRLSEAKDSGHVDTLSHNVGVVISPATQLIVGPDSGAGREGTSNTWTVNVDSTPEEGTKFLMLHFTDINLPGGNKIEVDLGYAKDTFTSSDGAEFWTRPINIYPLDGNPVEVRYITDGTSNSGKAKIDKIGVGKRSPGEDGAPPSPGDHVSFSNCDPFLKDAEYTKPEFDDFWYCGGEPRWEPSTCIGRDNPNDIRAKVAKSVGMILGPHGNSLSTCTVTLVSPDQIITAGHCITGPDAAQASSVIFNYETDCDGKRLSGYSPRFYKVEKVQEHIWDNLCRGDQKRDYARLKLKEVPAGVPPLKMRTDIPEFDEEVFGIHHPNGAPKVLSLPHKDGYTRVPSRPADSRYHIRVKKEYHVSGGSSGSGLFDKSGRVVGVLSWGSPCRDDLLRFFPMATFLEFATQGPTPAARDVMIVFDRSGSMTELDATGRSKMEVARDAASLFVQLVRKDLSNRIGLVSFQSSATLEAGLADVNDNTKKTLVGDAPFAKGKIGELVPEMSTSIGGGLDKARIELFTRSGNGNTQAILLMTDGMQNTPPMISDVEDNLGNIEVWSVGFGKDSNLDGKILDELSTDHCGMFTRATTGVSLQKFFAVAFGNIFEGGVLQDPEYDLPSNRDRSEPIPFHVCSEDVITVAVGWDNTAGELGIILTSPGGNSITASHAGVEAKTGRSWTFLRVPLPHKGERQGQWNVTVHRPPQPRRRSSHLEARQGSPPLRYFVNIIPTGGPRMSLDVEKKKYYTGDTIVPLVSVRYPDGSWPLEAKVVGTLTRPNASIGAALSASGLHQPAAIVDDTLPARQRTLGDIGFLAGSQQETFELSSESADTRGYFEESGIWGRVLNNSLLFEGDYQFHFRATTEGDCSSTREVLWSVHVDVGIDPAKTDVKTTFTGTTPGGKSVGTITIIPRDKFGNPVGPGRGDIIDITPGPGTIITGPVNDDGNGGYTVPIEWDPKTGIPPTIVITQPDRPPVVVQEPRNCTDPVIPGGTCQLCDPAPGKNKCHSTTACSSTPFGTMCTCRPGYRADKDVRDTKLQWRLKWPVAGHEHRVYVDPGVECNTLCNEWFLGAAGCEEVSVREC
ncbi:hypothetical protein ACJ41O_006398 [Fusarium nematophilum]